MAKKTETIVTLTDDLDGSKADRTVAFSYEGSSYEIELSKKNITALEKTLRPYIEKARKSSGSRKTRATTPAGRRSRPDLGAIRDWAKGQGIDVSERGRIAQAVQDAYDAAR